MPSQTRKKGQPRSPKQLGDLEWLRNPRAMLARAHSFENTTLTDEEFYKFFENIGESLSSSRKKSRTRSRNRGSKATSKAANKK